MTMRDLLPAVVITMALSACATGPTRFGPPCNTHECHAKVTVSDCKISVDPDVIEVAKGNRDVEIHWDITTSGFSFSEDGIVFNDDPQREFHNPRRPEPTKFIMNDRHTFAKEYKYTVVIRPSSACPALTLDPSVDND